MTSAPQIQPKFLPSRHDLGVVAVGFSGGQVRSSLGVIVAAADDFSQNLELTLRPWLLSKPV